MALDGAFGEVQLLGYLAVHVAHHDQAEDLLLPCRQRRRFDLPSVLARHAGLTRPHGPQARSECRVKALGEHDAGDPRREGRANLPPLDAGTDENDRRTLEALGQLLDTTEQPRYDVIDPHHDERWAVLGGLSEQCVHIREHTEAKPIPLKNLGDALAVLWSAINAIQSDVAGFEKFGCRIVTSVLDMED